MKVVRLVKKSDFKSIEHLLRHAGKGMTTMPKSRSQIKERISWSVSSQSKKSRKPNHDSYLFVLEDKQLLPVEEGFGWRCFCSSNIT